MNVCLNMIVKDEAKVIKRCLDSVKDHINQYVICDTGSTDGTQDIIREHLKDLPGYVLDCAWKDFAHNRNVALTAARNYDYTDWVLIMDADEVLHFEPHFEWPAPGPTGALIESRLANLTYSRLQLVNPHCKWKWHGVVHEILLGEDYPKEAMRGVMNFPQPDGARSGDPDKFIKDAVSLRKALRDDPANARNWFYAAQSYKDAGFIEESIACYEKRASMEGFEEEAWYSLLMVARLKELLDRPFEEVSHAYRAAMNKRRARNESLVDLAHYLNRHRRFSEARGYALEAVARSHTVPTDLLFVDLSYWGWRPRDELALSMHYLKDHVGAANIWRQLLDRQLPQEEVARVVTNLGFAERKQL